ncbi:hypothetical protein B0W47_14185 [Komagataeibacter nataicola]|uniref:Putative hydro-lyase B0W47_14185 n=1 Tax=Komagataeibacter nataicola TaxID=265960 RepID=A0A9N7H3H9_9PROT|nr:putative hydro-lyase [Komagataeibacter nataicola]AQU88413.1 hypothetical protein B0W47_14185 [Komagataeibacter nataicola]PYD65218.1 hypothetical protein CDI09_14870 [Komagataeibacter nataicola]WNM08866.1 putative hydro-lyase [Komagataeibacter nataicola]GBR21428.1 hypothetical protein AA0616_2030 [Komagataeibacter nataicola NRIC 0616]
MSSSTVKEIDYFHADPETVRKACRAGHIVNHTAGMATGYIQANLVMLPASLAADFHEFCQKNPRPCPLVGMSAPGQYTVPELGQDLDLRTDVPRYHVWKDGKMVDEVTDIRHYWQDDLVTFALGCSFSFENVMTACKVPLRHIQTGRTVPVYRTNIECTPVGPFAGPVVVSMRPFTSANIIRSVQISNEIPLAHGAPIHVGFPHEIGIADVMKPDYGEATDIMANELPVFWACGVTPQAVLAASKAEFAITHAPGAMLVTDTNHCLA